MIKGITKSGFRFEITEERLDNFELVSLFRQVESNSVVIVDIAELMLGEKQYNTLKKRCTKDGMTSSKKMFKEIGEILKVSKKIKK